MLINKGDIVLVPFPFTDLSETKLRPAVVLWVESLGQDVTLCFISSQNVDRVRDDEFVIQIGDDEFLQTGLKIVSKVRVTRVVTVERRLIQRRLGTLGSEYLHHLNLALVQAFQISL